MKNDVLLQYKNVDIIRGESLIVLKDVSFQVERGDLVYIVGKVGSGKSSLLQTIYAETPIHGGTAKVLEYDMNGLKRKFIPRLRRRMGIVFQDFRLLPDRSVFDNLDFVLRAIEFGSKTERDKRIEAVLKTVGMQNKSYKMPHELSGGEQQRVAIARALLNDPELVLADEPTGNLDPETGNKIFEILNNIAKQGKAVIISTHNHSLVDKFPGRVWLCEDKKVCHLP